MPKISAAIPFWGESALQCIYHLERACAVGEVGMWVKLGALREAMALKTIGKYHKDLLEKMVLAGWLEHKQENRWSPHMYRLTEASRVNMADRFSRACKHLVYDENPFFVSLNSR